MKLINAIWECPCGHINEQMLRLPFVSSDSFFFDICENCKNQKEVSVQLEALEETDNRGILGEYKNIVRVSLEYDLSPKENSENDELSLEMELIPLIPFRWKCSCGFKNDQNIKTDFLYNDDFFGGTCASCGEKKWIYITLRVNVPSERRLFVKRTLDWLKET